MISIRYSSRYRLLLILVVHFFSSLLDILEKLNVVSRQNLFAQRVDCFMNLKNDISLKTVHYIKCTRVQSDNILFYIWLRPLFVFVNHTFIVSSVHRYYSNRCSNRKQIEDYLMRFNKV